VLSFDLVVAIDRGNIWRIVPISPPVPIQTVRMRISQKMPRKEIADLSCPQIAGFQLSTKAGSAAARLESVVTRADGHNGGSGLVVVGQ